MDINEMKDVAFDAATTLLETNKLPESIKDYNKGLFNTYVSVFLAGMTIENIKQEKNLINPVKKLAKALTKLNEADIAITITYLLDNLADEAPEYAANRLTILKGNVRQEISQIITSDPDFKKEHKLFVEGICSGFVDSFVLKNEVDKRVNPRFKGIK